MKSVTIELPDELVQLAGLQSSNLSHEALKFIVLELYREEVVSLGKAAELSSLSIGEFMDFAASRKVSIHYGMQELEEDRETLKRLFK